MFTKSLALAAAAVAVEAHIALWDAGMFGLNHPYQADDTANINWNNNDPVNPLREMDGLTQAQWFGHGFIGFPPASGKFMTLPSGGTYHGEHGCNRAETSLRDPAITDPLPYYACPAGDNSTGVGALHTMNTYGGSFDPSWQGGAALAIAYTSDPSTLQPNDLTVISVNQTSVWARAVDYQIPAGLPPCPAGGCLCTWNWIHEANHGEGYPFEIYNVLYRCQVTGATDATKKVQRGAVPVDCSSNAAACVSGPKTPMYIYQYTGNNIAHLADPPNYKPTWGFADGAQNDIFTPAAKPAGTTYIVNAYAKPTGTSTAAGTPTATALPEGWISYGCSVDQDSPRVFNGPSTASDNNTISGCTASCAAQGYTWAGVEYGRECWCGTNALMSPTNSSACNVPCSGDPWANCGGSYAVEVFFGPSTAAVPADDAELPTGWADLGCYTDADSPRTLASGYTSATNMTWSSCINHCEGLNYKYAGVEYGQECWCGNSLNTSRATTSGCDVLCAGDDARKCGGSYRLEVFGPGTTTPAGNATANATTTTTAAANATVTSSVKLNATTSANATVATTKPISVNVTTTATTIKATTNSTTLAATATTKLTSIVSVTTKTTTPISVTTAKTTTPMSVTTAKTTTPISVTTAKTTTTISVTTTAKTTSTTTKATTTTSTTAAATSSLIPAGWTSLGCYIDTPVRALSVYLGQTWTNTPATCITRCSALGYTYAGVEGPYQCYCSNTPTLKPTTAQTDCSFACAGDSKQICGANWRINVFQKNNATQAATTKTKRFVPRWSRELAADEA
ncbi:hypothetical protein Q5752_006316 [Cryptotrichosporon argae]